MEPTHVTPIPPHRIVGEVTLERMALLARVDAVVNELRPSYVWELSSWELDAVLSDTATRRPGGYVVALRARPAAGSTLQDCGRFPWECLEDLASRIVADVWEVTTVVPDVVTVAPPPLADASSPHTGFVVIDDDGWHRLTA